MKTYKYNMIIFLFLLLAVILLIFSIKFMTAKSTPISVKPELPTPTFMLPDAYAFRQDDDRWGHLTIGATSDSMRAYGCTISSVAMAASNLTDEAITPEQLMTRLTEEDGFTERGWLIWGRLPAATNNQISSRIYRQPDHGHIHRCMTDGGYPIVKFLLGGRVVHWAVIVGTTEDDYLIRDPLYGGPDDPPVTLSSRTDEIESIRCILRSE